MNNSILVSVVIPVYNVERYLDRCVKSVIKQTYQNIEIILVDDGSKDNSGKLCDSFSSMDERIKVVHKENGGLGSARNVGIKSCSGDYICFVDSDDWIALDTIQYCVNLVLSNGTKVDVVEYGIIETSKYDYKIKQPKEKIKVIEGKDILQFLMYYSTKTDGYFSACRCLFRSGLIKNNLFVEGKINEDISWKYKVFKQSTCLIDTNQIKYFYFQSTGSITTDGLKKRDYDLYMAADELMKLSEHENYGSIHYLAKVKKARTPLSLLCKIAFYGVSDPDIEEHEAVQALKKELKQNLKTIIFSPIPISRKLLAVMMSISFETTKWLVQIMKKFLVVG